MTDVLLALYPWSKSLHIIAVVAWMAGLFYLPRLFVYHVERGGSNPGLAGLFETMEMRLHRFIMTPAMIATWVFGLILVVTPGVIDWSAVWPWTKAGGVVAMTVFHLWCHTQRSALASDGPRRSGSFYRKMNEVPTILLIVIVVSVIARPF